MKEIRLSGMPTGKEKIIENYHPEKPEEIMFIPCVVEGMNRSGFTRFLYYPRHSEKTINDEYGTRVVTTTLATTLMIETMNKSGRKKWETIGHIWGMNDLELEELGFQKWKESDYDYKVPNSKIEIEKLDKKTIKELNVWMVEQGLKPITLKKFK
jgi:hypothetical protein